MRASASNATPTPDNRYKLLIMHGVSDFMTNAKKIRRLLQKPGYIYCIIFVF